MKLSDIRKKSSGFTLIELLVVISIIAVLMSILMPALTKVRQQAKNVMCKNNQHQILLGVMGYQSDWQDTPPTIQHLETSSGQVPTIPTRVIYHSKGDGVNGGSLGNQLSAYLPDPIIYHCPVAPYEKVDTTEVYKDGGDWLNGSYFYFWNYLRSTAARPVFRVDGKVTEKTFIGPGRKSKSKVLVSDALDWINNSAHPFEWQSSHQFEGSSAMRHPYNSGPPHNLQLEYGQYIKSDRTKTIPEVDLNVGYIDGSVSVVSSEDMVDAEFGGFKLVVPQWW